MASTRGPDSLLQDLNQLFDRLRETGRSLSATEQCQALDLLVEVYNLLSATQHKPNLSWVIRSQSAASHRTQEALSEAVRALEDHKKHVQSMYQGADAFLKAVQIGGYAAAFAVWGFTRSHLSSSSEVVVGLLLLLSVMVFAVWELYKALSVVWGLDQHDKATTAKVEELPSVAVRILNRLMTKRLRLPYYRTVAFVVSVVPAIIAVVVLLGSFVTLLWDKM